MGSLAFDQRLVAYNPLGSRIGVLPDLGFTITSTASGPSLTASVTRASLGQVGALGNYLEIAVESWHTTRQLWTEDRDSRFVVSTQEYDDRDQSQIVSLTGIGLTAYLMAGAALAGVEPYINTTGASEAARSNTSANVSGTTWTWSGHVLDVGDRVQIVSVGSAKKITTGGVYYVINPTTNTFQLAAGPTGTAINAGSAGNVSIKRVVTRIVFTGTHKFTIGQLVSTTGGAALGLQDGTAYYVVNPTAATIQLTDQPGGIPVELSAASTAVTQVYRNLDGQRVFGSTVAGGIMASAFDEAVSRGWGVNPSTSTTAVSRGWTFTADSKGNPWTTMAADPATPGIAVTFQPGTPMTSMLQFMLENKYAEWYSAGRTIHMVNPGTGVDGTALNPPLRIGSTATQVPVVVDLASMRNAVTVRGTGPIIDTEAQPGYGPFGRLEVYETQSGATTKSTAIKQAQVDLAENLTGQVGYTVTENANEAPYLPGIHYARNDWVAVQIGTDGWKMLRVVQWQFIKTPDGTITVTTTLAYAKRSLLTQTAKGQIASSAGINDKGSTTSPLLVRDTQQATYPLGVLVTQTARFAADDTASSSVTVSWLPVSKNINGGDLSIQSYQVWLREEGAARGTVQGVTNSLSLTLPPLPSGRTFNVQVRAQADSDTWGQLSPELEFITTYPATVPNPPTAPTLSGKLGQVRVAWDGNLVDPTLGNTAASSSTQQGFGYVYAAYSTAQNGTYIPVGMNMGNAGFTSVSGLTVGSTYWFALFAVNTVGVASPMSTAVSYTVVGVTGPDIVANSVTANNIAAGAISVDKINLGTVPMGSPTDRVPQPFTSDLFWSTVLSGTNPISPGLNAANAASNTGYGPGITLNNGGYFFIMPQTPPPPSGKIHISGLTDDGGGNFVVRAFFDVAANSYTDGAYPVNPNGYVVPLPAGTVAYYVYATSANGRGYQRFLSGHVFEVVGAGTGGQAAELSPQGLRLYDTFGQVAVDLTTSTQQYISVLDNTQGYSRSVASIDLAGNAAFTQVSADNFDVDGTNLVHPQNDGDWSNSLAQGTTSNGYNWASRFGNLGPVPLLDRLGRGAIYDVTWTSTDNLTVPVGVTYQRIAADSFTLQGRRQYMFLVQFGNIQVVNTSGFNVYLEWQISLSPMSLVSDGTRVMRSVVYGSPSSAGNFSFNPIVFTAYPGVTGIDFGNRVLPSDVPIYWQLNTTSSSNTASYKLTEFGNERGVTVIDIGSSYAVRPYSGGDQLPDVTDRSQNATTPAPSTTAKPVTKTFACTWSNNYDQNGTRINGGSPNNPRFLYQGNMGGYGGSSAIFGFGNLGLAGKTITNAQLFVRNVRFPGSSNTVRLGTSSAASAPSTLTTRTNGWDQGISDGDGKWITIPSSLWPSIASGAIMSFTTGYSSASSDLGYFEGYNAGPQPPQLKITYK